MSVVARSRRPARRYEPAQALVRRTLQHAYSANGPPGSGRRPWVPAEAQYARNPLWLVAIGTAYLFGAMGLLLARG